MKEDVAVFRGENDAFERRRPEGAVCRAIIDAIPDYLFRLSPEGVFLSSKSEKNPFCMNCGSSPLGRHVEEVFPHEVAGRFMVALYHLLHTDEMQ